MRQYEMMVILDPDVEERTLQALIEKLVAVVPAEGGTVDNVDIWGRRKMTFDINKKSEGLYAVIDFTSEVATAKELDRQLGLNETVLRFKILRADAK
ncbi:MAG: 30S ribosomal protein S6 [Promicromonosporaceae bacterium]|nr:30S ribosomal protein S6 [Promicromonosporaceae bacterium]